MVVAKPETKSKTKNPLSFKYKKDAAKAEAAFVHHYKVGKSNFVCQTDNLGHETPQNKSPLDLVVNTPGGMVQLWDKGVTLRWRFQERSMSAFRKPEDAKMYLRHLLAQGILLWGDAVPVTFKEVTDGWDFEIAVRAEEKCSVNGCTLASAFFPDAGQHELVIYPTLFKQPEKEQIETMAHELGHVFGLRHFFAKVSETAWPAEVFGKHVPFSIMNYGADSTMTANDQSDLKALYQLAWTGQLRTINNTAVNLVRPYSTNLSTVCSDQSATAMSSSMSSAMDFGGQMRWLIDVKSVSPA